MLEEDDHVPTTTGGSIRNSTIWGIIDPWQRPSNTMPLGSKARLGAEWREEQQSSSDSSYASDSASGAGGGEGGMLKGYLIMALYASVACTYFDSCAVAAGGLIATAAVRKVASDFKISRNYKRTLTALSVVGTGVATYLVATSKQPTTHLAFINAGRILVGTGMAMAGYVVSRDVIHWKLGWSKDKFEPYRLGWMTAAKVALCGLVVAAGMWSNPFFSWFGQDHWSGKAAQPHAPQLHHRPAYQKTPAAVIK